MADDLAEETDVNCRRTLAISALIFSLVLVGGAIYLHIREQQQEAEGYSNFMIAVPTAAAIDPEMSGIPTATRTTHNDNNFSTKDADEPIEDDDEYENEYDYDDDDDDDDDDDYDNDEKKRDIAFAMNTTRTSLDYDSNSVSASISAETTSSGEDVRFGLSTQTCIPAPPASNKSTNSTAMLSELCLQCICETATECQTLECSSGLNCGLFRISFPYWIEAGRPRLQGVDDIKTATEHVAYSQCVNNPFCAARAVTATVAKYQRDCNNDGKIDCWDHAELHMLGPTGCMHKELQPIFIMRLKTCMAKFS